MAKRGNHRAGDVDATDWLRSHVSGMPFSWRLGCRGHPGPVPAWRLLVERAARSEGRVLDASGLLGIPGRAAARDDRVQAVTILEPSAAALAALEHDRITFDADVVGRCNVVAGLPWDVERGAWDVVLLAPPAERGTARVHAELAAAASALREGGVVWLLLDRDRGAKRYTRDARTWFGDVDVVARDGAARLVRLARPGVMVTETAEPWRSVHDPEPLTGGPWLALPGVWSPDRVDPGTRVLLDALAAHEMLVAGMHVLDLGCGWGPLAAAADAAGAVVTAVDDDLAAVRSCARNVPNASVHHVDVVSGGRVLANGFDVVLVNPPFHVGQGSRTVLGATFVQCAMTVASGEGGAWIVANEALDYEAIIRAQGRTAREVTRKDRFKVLHVASKIPRRSPQPRSAV